MSKITIGADPELCFFKGNTPISAIGKVGGSKAEPRPVPGGYSVQEDNVAFEFNIPACQTSQEFMAHNMFMLGHAQAVAMSYGLEARNVASAVFSDEELDHPMAHVFGCDADYDAWNLEVNPAPAADNPNLRSFGGHIHIGAPDMTKIQRVMLVRALDCTVGLALAYLEPKNDRAKLYGNPGAMRVKPYGVEWRTPSNYWLSSPGLIYGVAETVLRVSGMFLKHGRLNEQLEMMMNDDLMIHHFFKEKALPDFWLGSVDDVLCGDLWSNVYRKSTGKNKVEPKATRSKYKFLDDHFGPDNNGELAA